MPGILRQFCCFVRRRRVLLRGRPHQHHHHHQFDIMNKPFRWIGQKKKKQQQRWKGERNTQIGNIRWWNAGKQIEQSNRKCFEILRSVEILAKRNVKPTHIQRIKLLTLILYPKFERFYYDLIWCECGAQKFEWCSFRKPLSLSSPSSCITLQEIIMKSSLRYVYHLTSWIIPRNYKCVQRTENDHNFPVGCFKLIPFNMRCNRMNSKPPTFTESQLTSFSSFSFIRHEFAFWRHGETQQK